jgi:glutaredoxin
MDDEAQWEALEKRSGMKTMPQIFVGDRLIGGYTDLADLDGKDQLSSLKN